MADQVIAITREVGPRLDQCELTHFVRREIDVEKARKQHLAYEQCLTRLGLTVMSLPGEPELPDSVFVEDVAVVLDEIAVISRMGAESRRQEADSVRAVIESFRPLGSIRAPATLDGGDVLKVGRTLFVGRSSRTNAEGVDQLKRILGPYGYEVRSVATSGCLHLKTGCSYIGRNTILANPALVDTNVFDGRDVIAVDKSESLAANTLAIGGVVLLPDCFPRTHSLLEKEGFPVSTLDVSELQKTEAGLTCMSIIISTRGVQEKRS